MTLYKNNYFISDSVNINKITYGFFSKKGGFSKNKYDSLNCSTSSGDEKKTVVKNIEIAKKNLGLIKKQLIFLKQSHSSRVTMIDNNNINKSLHVDGSITKDRNIALAIMTADCAPIFIFDTKCSIICSLHAGWKGCLKNIVRNAVKKMLQINIKSQNLIAIVGPCLEKENFEVDKIFKDTFINENKQYQKFFIKNLKDNKYHFDMRGLINFQLQNSAINKISNIMIDTYSNTDLFFSHRRAQHNGTIQTGRMINIIAFSKTS